MEGPVWGWQTVIYLWVAGIAGGTYMCAMLVNLWAGQWYRGVVRVATYLTIPLLLVGAAALTADLGQPARFWHLFAAWRPSSPMWFGTYILALGSLVGAGLILHEVLTALSVRVPGAQALEFLVTWVGLVLAGVLVVYVAVLLTATSRVLWSATILLPALFAGSALSMGAAMILAVTRLRKIPLPRGVFDRLRQVGAISLVFEAIVLAVLLVTLALFSSPLASGVVQGILIAPLGIAFWLGVVILGILVPLGLEFLASKAIPDMRASILVVAWFSVLLGGLVLRYVVVYGGQTQGWISRLPL